MKKLFENLKNENGAIIVEATFIFPLVIMTVMALIYLGLFKLQEGAILYQVQKVTRQADYIVASPGYQKLGTLDAKSLDFENNPSKQQTVAYYKAYHENLQNLYREIFGCRWATGEAMTPYASSVMESLYIFTGFSVMESKVSVKRNFLSSTVTVTTTMEYPLPGVLRYLGFENNILLKQEASTVSMNPADFIRDVDMAWDGVKALAKTFNVDLDNYVSKFQEIITFL